MAIWYTVTEHEGQEIISVQHVSLDTWPLAGEVGAWRSLRLWDLPPGRSEHSPLAKDVASGMGSVYRDRTGGLRIMRKVQAVQPPSTASLQPCSSDLAIHGSEAI